MTVFGKVAKSKKDKEREKKRKANLPKEYLHVCKKNKNWKLICVSE